MNTKKTKARFSHLLRYPIWKRSRSILKGKRYVRKSEEKGYVKEYVFKKGKPHEQSSVGRVLICPFRRL